MGPEGIPNESNDIPAELRGPTPRSVRLSGTGWLNLLAAALFLGLGVVGTIAIVEKVLHDAATQKALRQNAGESVAKVTEIWTSRRRVSYSFSVDGISFTGKSEVPTDNLRNLHTDDSLPVRYIPANPNINHPAAWEDPPYSTLWLLYLPVTPMFIGLMLVRKFPVQCQLAMKGIAVRGFIAKTEWNGPQKGQRYANYTFRNASNDEVEIGRCPSDYIYRADLNCWVLYLPTNPSRSEIYPFPIDFFRINR
jgi:hypothetical protein